MKKNLLLLSVLIFFLIIKLNGLSSKIDEVTVYRNSALITRIIAVPAQVSLSKIEIGNLPNSMDENSIQILSTGNIVISSFDVKRVYEKGIENKTLKELNKKLKKLKNKFLKYKNHMYVLEEKKKFLDTIRESFTTINSGEKKNRMDWRSAYRFFGISIDSLLTDSLRTALKIGDVESQMKVLKDKINQYTPTKKNCKKLLIYTEKTDDKSGKIKIKYIVNNTTWTPFYRFNIKNLDGKYNLLYLAKIRQNSGEDWNNVKLTVSTSTPEIPSFSAHVPSWYLYPYVKRKETISKSMLYRGSDKLASVPSTWQNVASAQINKNLYSAIFTLPDRVTIHSVKSEKTVFLANIKGKGKLSLFASPIVSKYVYAHMDFVNDNNFSLLPGKMDILWNGDYNGKGYVPITIAGDTVSIECGVDKGVKVTRILVTRKFDKGNVLSKYKSYYFKYRTDVKNGHNRKIKITVEDRIPVSKDKNIKVVGVKISPKDYFIDKNGIIKFTLDIPAKKDITLFVEYKIVIPKAMSVNGLL